MSGATFLINKCCCAPRYRIYRPCCGVEGPYYWGTDFSVFRVMVGDVCYGWYETTSDPADIDGLDELPTGDFCECDCEHPDPPYYIFAPCCGSGYEYWTDDVSATSQVFSIGGTCYGYVRTTSDPDEIEFMAELPGAGCTCVSLAVVLNSEICGYVCVDCVDVYIGVEIYGNGEYEIGYWKLNGAEYLWYFDGASCDREEAEVPPWEGAAGYKCAGDELITVERFAAIHYAIKGCPVDLPAYEEITSHSPDSFTYGDPPECPE